jgi:chaperonin GroES
VISGESLGIVRRCFWPPRLPERAPHIIAVRAPKERIRRAIRESRPEVFSMKIRPLQDRVLVRRVKEDEKTKGGLFIPDSAKEKPVEAIVLAVGNGKILEDGTVRALDVKAGDRVLFGKYTGSEVKIDGEEALILREDDILGILEG